MLYFYFIDWNWSYYSVIKELLLKRISRKRSPFLLCKRIYLKLNFRMYQTGFG